MALLKLLCIFAATLGLHTASTSPNPPQSDSELKPIKSTGLEFIASRRLRIIQRMVYWVIGIAETAVIVAQLAPPSSWAEKVLATLAIGGKLSRVQSSLSTTPTVAFGSFLIACGALLRLQCYHALGRHFTFEVGIFSHHKLVTTGPYRIVRHPSYTGALLAYAGLMLYYASPGTWIMECVIKGSMVGRIFGVLYALLMFIVVTGLTWRIPKEDDALRAVFGKEWEDWAAERYALVPGLY
ncbi:hypothetical protein C8F04DRAFT_960141 [Mycena alexandri]|uniref:Protein-S-isoprenylcysteine O-methyltransferase n=1 Tax=Mycena alexandri TaxID=1745969 RepID=A0AAD6X4A2_9AGAR|nr:hypothetical protein C8F04DRAFT_960141 [Mycena alexandri]